MVTVTSFLSILYTPLTPLAEKLPDVSFPLKSASFSIAALLALATNVPGSFAETKLNVLGILRLLSPLMKQHFEIGRASRRERGEVSAFLLTRSSGLAALLALATNVPGSFAETKLNVLGILRLLSPLMKQHFDGLLRHVRVLPVWLAENLRSTVCQPAKHSAGPIGLCDRGYAKFPRTSYTGNWVSENFVC